ncbi:orotate phosphoribosyltransferase [Petroclostridium sp. X23]|uniref:orotate phosphoribosyltransferase n=1 Tax=Petroclostridium sp. X23 TaxID=3045146 RepID=UPI0024AD2026|nr:orotate phosphoribosyltransferase [Petroclostridium sp. X23]WHH61592.1 orotate phosphoribosyltransferase [Petroclostridium sp. X23]
MITKERVLEVLKEAGVLLEGHFLLTSGRHSNKYLQCAKIFQYTKYSEELCKALAEKYKDAGIDLVIGPAIGAIQMSYEVSRWLDVKNIFAERDNGVMALRRGFTIEKGQKVLIVEDVVTTGGSVKEVIEIVKEAGGEVAGVGAVVDRTGGKIDFGTRFESVISMEVESYEPDQCPLCKQGIPYIKPGSRQIK